MRYMVLHNNCGEIPREQVNTISSPHSQLPSCEVPLGYLCEPDGPRSVHSADRPLLVALSRQCRRAMILFLDFDGVLHPTSDGELFSSLPLLEAVLCDVSHVRVVISSSWRELHGLRELREFFCEDLRERIIGTTPLYGSAELVPKGRAKYRRHAECLAWLAASDDKRWLALDDQEFLYRPGCRNLLLADGRTGLTERDVVALRKRLLA